MGAVPNGTIILGTRRTTNTDYPTWVGHASSPGGPWTPLKTQVLPTAAGSPSTSEEDSFIFKGRRGYHMLTHRSTPKNATWPPHPSTGCGGGHLYSEDLRTWFFGEAVFGRSADSIAQCNVQLQPDGTTMKLTSRQRPTILTAPDGRRYLYTGASGPDIAITECACPTRHDVARRGIVLALLVVSCLHCS